MTASPYWTSADEAEAGVLVFELLNGVHAHRERCPTCKAMAAPCPGRETIAREQDEYDRTPLEAPPGVFAEIRERLVQHEAACETCRLMSRGRCPAVHEAIQVLLDWRLRRHLLSKAQYLRALEDRGAAA